MKNALLLGRTLLLLVACENERCRSDCEDLAEVAASIYSIINNVRKH